MAEAFAWAYPSPMGLAALVLGYLLGSIPFGIIQTRLTGGPDLRTIGSGNIGATNVLRTGRKGIAAATLLLDMLKGTVAVLLVYEVAKRFPAYAKTEDFLAAIGYGVVTTAQVATELSKTPLPDVLQPTKAAPSKPMTARFQITGVGDLYTTLATCCKPVNGDQIVGYVPRGRGITVHRADCPNLVNLPDPERLIQVLTPSISNAPPTMKVRSATPGTMRASASTALGP